MGVLANNIINYSKIEVLNSHGGEYEGYGLLGYVFM
jgi:hypothetical protein